MTALDTINQQLLLQIREEVSEFCKKEKLIFNMEYDCYTAPDMITGHNEHITILFGDKSPKRSHIKYSFYGRSRAFCGRMSKKYKMWFAFEYVGLAKEDISNMVNISIHGTFFVK